MAYVEIFYGGSETFLQTENKTFLNKWYRLGVDNSGIPQGSVPCSICFLTIYINDLPDVVQNIANLFSDDTKVYAIVNKEEEQHSLQNDINNRVHWSDKWLLKFNKSKCKYVHLGHATNTKHKMGENEINQVTEENDIGILIDDKLKFQQHINQQTKQSKPKTWHD